jgi:hypothetical protein
VKVGREVIPVLSAKKDKIQMTKNQLWAQLEVVKKIDLQDFSHSLMYGPLMILRTPIIESVSDWENIQSNNRDLYTLSVILHQNAQALILKTNIDLVTGENRAGQVIYYYILIGDKDGTSLFMRKVVTADEYFPCCYSKTNANILNGQSSEMALLLESMLSETYSPLEYSSNQHQYISNIISNAKIIYSPEGKRKTIDTLSNANQIYIDTPNNKQAKQGHQKIQLRKQSAIKDKSTSSKSTHPSPTTSEVSPGRKNTRSNINSRRI